MEYEKFIESKHRSIVNSGITDGYSISARLFPFQKDIVEWALKTGRAAIWADCGLGKTLMALEWAKVVCENHSRVLILTPLAVSRQFINEHGELGMSIGIKIIESTTDIEDGISLCNYEKLHKLDVSSFDGVVLDESSILKSYTGKVRNMLVDQFSNTRYKLCCTATPSPNDIMELTNHCEFLGVMTRVEMLAMYFIHDGGTTSKWRLRGHSEHDFWTWVCTWAVYMHLPSDIGYPDDDFILPELNVIEHVIPYNYDDGSALDGSQVTVFDTGKSGLIEQRLVRNTSVNDRVNYVADIINNSDETWIIWCNLNAESTMLNSAIHNSIEVTGSQSLKVKESKLESFSNGDERILITKPLIAGWGMNWQHCHNIAFVGIDNSFESWYQAIRRSYRFGQPMDVNCHIVITEADNSVLLNLKRKHKDAKKMQNQMAKYMGRKTNEN